MGGRQSNRATSRGRFEGSIPACLPACTALCISERNLDQTRPGEHEGLRDAVAAVPPQWELRCFLFLVIPAVYLRPATTKAHGGSGVVETLARVSIKGTCWVDGRCSVKVTTEARLETLPLRYPKPEVSNGYLGDAPGVLL